jgi:hypothetical protein
MREAAETVREIGLAPWSAAATADRQAWVADLVERGELGAEADAEAEADWRAYADQILRRRGG